MTVSTEVDHNEYTGNGVTTIFPYTFRIFQKSDLVVQVVDLDENITLLVLDTDYTVTGAGGYTGGNVILTTALANGYQISISRELPVTQETDLRNQGKFFAEVHEDAFDKLTMLIQQVRSWFSLALRKPTFVANYYDAQNNYIRNLRDPARPQDATTKSYVDAQDAANFNRTLRVSEPVSALPSASFRANKMIAFDSAGNPIVVLPPSGSASDVMIELAKPTGGRHIGLEQGGTIQDAVFAVTPQAYGAVCDGVADDSEAFQALLNTDAMHVIVTIPPGSILRIDKQVTFNGRRLEFVGYSGIMNNKVPTNTHSQIFCNVENDFAIVCNQADLVLKDVIVKGIPVYSMGIIGTQKGILTSGGSIQTSFTTFMGLALPFSTAGGFYNKFYQTEWLACKDGCDIQQAFNISFFGCRVAGINRFFPMSGVSGNGPINFYGCSFENFTNYIVGTEVASLIRYQSIGFHGCYFENMDDQTVYDGLTPRGNASIPSEPFYGKYAYARIIVGTPFAVIFDASCSMYLKGIENVMLSLDSWGIQELTFKAKMIESNWVSHQEPLSVIRTSFVKTADLEYNTTAGSGVLSFPLISPNNSSTLPTIRSGFGVSANGKSVIFNGYYNQTVTFTSVAAGVNTYQDIVFNDAVDLVNASACLTSRSAASAMATLQMQVLSSKTLRLHLTNGHSSPVTFDVKVVVPYAYN